MSHLVALSVVGTDRLLASGYFRAKNAQEQLIKESAIPFSLVRATQFFEFVGRVADSATDGDTVRISSALSQPMAADDVATAVASTAVGQPVGGILEVAGPDRYPLDDLVRARLRANNDTAASSQIRNRATSAYCSTTTPWCPAPTQRCSPPASRTGSSTTRSPRPSSTPAQNQPRDSS